MYRTPKYDSGRPITGDKFWVLLLVVDIGIQVRLPKKFGWRVYDVSRSGRGLVGLTHSLGLPVHPSQILYIPKRNGAVAGTIVNPYSYILEGKTKAVLIQPLAA